MPGSRALLLVLLVAAGAVVWLLVGRRGEEASWPNGEPAALADRAGEPAKSAPRLPAALPPPPEAPAPEEPEPEAATRPVLPTDEIPRGGLDVYVTDARGRPVAAGALTVTLTREPARFWSAPLGIENRDTGAVEFRDLPVGRVRVAVHGLHVVEASEEAVVAEDEVATVTVPVLPAGAIRYTVLSSGGEAPGRLRLQVRREQDRRWLKAWFRPDRSSPRQATATDSGPEGWIEALAPGRYVLRAEGADGESGESTVDVAEGSTASVSIGLHR